MNKPEHEVAADNCLAAIEKFNEICQENPISWTEAHTDALWSWFDAYDDMMSYKENACRIDEEGEEDRKLTKALSEYPPFT